jgi:flagellar protein FliJ
MAGFELRRLKKALLEQDQQLDQLNGYRSEYNKQFLKVGESGLDVAQLQNYHLFFRRLNDAIDQQDSNVEAHHEHLDEGEERWRQEYRKANTLDKARERAREVDRKDSEKTAQKRTEEAINARRGRDSLN